ncbi:MAG TPA: hypothetical protein CFH84_05070 [Sulfurimonas sp. UBA12504]|nr:MAG: hypothetical protein A2019_05355 [Sulfurimonas sp. GWF2_37_8]DAB30290.1 MAG TPA: hypothetical protein CFH84_05070 [Sulfurimonas sp. UBA12504]
MKRRLFLSILFIIATIVTALHEIKHIENHDNSSCQICILDSHSVAADISVDYKEAPLYHFEAISPQTQIFTAFSKKTTNNANAPPFFS